MINRENLKLLANYLAILAPQKSKDTFDMTDFATNSHGDPVSPLNVNSCGTVRCALGHAPAIGAEFAPLPSETEWPTYSKRVFGMNGFKDSDSRLEFEFMFGDLWSEVDNTIEEAIQRIRYYLECGLPDEFYNPSVYSHMPTKLEVRRCLAEAI